MTGTRLTNDATRHGMFVSIDKRVRILSFYSAPFWSLPSPMGRIRAPGTYDAPPARPKNRRSAALNCAPFPEEPNSGMTGVRLRQAHVLFGAATASASPYRRTLTPSAIRTTVTTPPGSQ